MTQCTFDVPQAASVISARGTGGGRWAGAGKGASLALPTTRGVPPMPMPGPSAPDSVANGLQVAVLQGVRAYGQALHAAGGRQVGMRARERGGSTIAVALYASPAHELRLPALPVARLAITLTGLPLFGSVGVGELQAFQAARYNVFHTPAGYEARWRKEVPSRHLSLYFDADALADSGIGKELCLLGEEPQLNVSIPGIRPLVDELLAELAGGADWSGEAIDSLGRLLLIRIARHRARRSAAAPALAPHLIGRLTDHALAHLTERLLVGDLAAVVGMSPYRFAQACVAGTGLSPHQFVMALRLRQAQALLRDENETLAGVAAACGFASQQHLTQLMRKRLGTTPARYRRELPARVQVPGWRADLAARPAAAAQART